MLLVILVPCGVSVLALLGAFWLDLIDIVAGWFVSSHVMLTLWHGVGITCVFVSMLTASHDTGFSKPVPWRLDLTTIAALRIAGEHVATRCGISG